MVMRAVTLIAVIAVASAASIGQQKCCGPAEWEAMAVASAAYGYATSEARSMSGSMMVDHSKQLMALYLMSMNNGTNDTMKISMNNSMIIVYFMMNRMNQNSQMQQVCTAYVMKQVVADLSSSCFPDKQSDDLLSSLGQRSGVLAYEFAGLGGLIGLQILANAQDCTPASFGMSTAAANGPLLNVMLSNINPSMSDISMSGAPAECENVMPVEILMPQKAMVSSRQSSMKPTNRRQPSLNNQQWIDDLVTMYLVKMMRPHVSPRQKRDTIAAGGLIVHTSDKPTTSQIIQSAQALRQMMQTYNEFMNSNQPSRNNTLPNDTKPNLPTNSSRAMGLKDLLAAMEKMNLISGWTSPQHMDPKDLLAAMEKMNLISGMRSGDVDPKDVIDMLLKLNMLSGMTSGRQMDPKDLLAIMETLNLVSGLTPQRKDFQSVMELLGKLSLLDDLNSDDVSAKDLIEAMKKLILLSDVNAGKH